MVYLHENREEFTNAVNLAKEKAYKSFQILAEYLEGKGITGIIYPCTRTNRIKGKNVVLFNIHDAEPISASIMQYYYGKYTEVKHECD